MALAILGREVSTALIIDDEQDARESYAETLEDAGLTPLPLTNFKGSPEAYLALAQEKASAVLCDQFLSHHNYAHFEGAQLVKLLYDAHLPAVLCTYYDELVDDIRPYRRWVPSLQRPFELDGGAFVGGLEECLREFDNCFQPHRQPWRTQIKVIDVRSDEKRFFVEIPAWASTIVPLKYDGVPSYVTDNLSEGWRCRAYVNLGAEHLVDLYVCDWEIPPS
jgi:CheY-like chemotaxis protein